MDLFAEGRLTLLCEIYAGEAGKVGGVYNYGLVTPGEVYQLGGGGKDFELDNREAATWRVQRESEEGRSRPYCCDYRLRQRKNDGQMSYVKTYVFRIVNSVILMATGSSFFRCRSATG